jgi:hypothetical protein
MIVLGKLYLHDYYMICKLLEGFKLMLKAYTEQVWVDAKVTHNVELKLFLEWLDINIHCTNNVFVLLNVGCLKKKIVN